jgi:phosphomethylpyrimidine synthase
MKITQVVRDYAAQKGLEEEASLQAGMKEKAEEFKKSGAQIYVEAASSAESSPVEFKAAGKE